MFVFPARSAGAGDAVGGSAVGLTFLQGRCQQSQLTSLPAENTLRPIAPR